MEKDIVFVKLRNNIKLINIQYNFSKLIKNNQDVLINKNSGLLIENILEKNHSNINFIFNDEKYVRMNGGKKCKPSDYAFFYKPYPALNFFVTINI